MSREDAEAAMLSLQAFAADRSEPRPYRDWADAVIRQLDTILNPVPNRFLSPVQGDDVDKWLRDWREATAPGPERRAIVALLDEYQLRATLGLTLFDELPEPE